MAYHNASALTFNLTKLPAASDQTMICSWRVYIVLLTLAGFCVNAETTITAPDFQRATRTTTLDQARLLRTHKIVVDGQYDSEDKNLHAWLESHTKVDDVFNNLQLNLAKDKLFENPNWKSFTEYVAVFNKNDAEDSTVKNELLQGWVDFTTSPNQVFKLLKLDKVDDKLLTSPLLSTSVEYMHLFNKGLPTKKTTMIAVFTKNYGDEGLAKMLQKAKETTGTKEFATNLQNAQFNLWMSEGRNPKNILEDVLKLDSTTFAKELGGDIWRAYAKNIPDAELRGDIWRAYNKAYAKTFPESGFAFQP